MTDTIYYTILAILVALFSPFVWYALKEKSFKTKSSDLENENTTISKENSELKKTIFQKEKKSLGIKDAYDKQQIELADKNRKLSMLAKFTFDSGMGTVKIGDEHYCTKCVLEFKETKLDTHGNDLKCPVCDTDYLFGKHVVTFPNH